MVTTHRRGKGAGKNEPRVCFTCGNKDHISYNCPKKNKEEGTDDGVDEQGGRFIATLERGVQIPKSWVLLSFQSTVDVFCNPKLLSNIRKAANTTKVSSEDGDVMVTMVGDLAGYGTVWYYPSGIANILSLSSVTSNGLRVTFDSKEGDAFRLHRKDAGVRIFQKSHHGIYYSDLRA